MKNFFLSLPIIILLSCSSQNKTDTLSADSTATDSTVVAVTTTAEAPPEDDNLSIPVSGLAAADTLFNFLARREIVRGEFGDVTVLTDKLIEPENLNSERNLLAVLVHSGEGSGYDTKFARLYTVLAVFEVQADQLLLVDTLEFDEGGSYGIARSYTTGSSVKLAENKFAALVHYHDVEDGAGDSGYRRESAEVYVLVNNKLEKVFESPIEDFSFASDEESSYRETTITTTVTVLNEKANGLFNIELTTSGSATELEDGESTTSEGESDDQEKKQDGVYQWNGKSYEWVKEG